MSADIIGIVFSKDRAMQLDATLKSFFLHCVDPEHVRLKVLYAASSGLFLKQYKKLQVENPGVDFVLQSDFKLNLWSMLGLRSSWWDRMAIKIGMNRRLATPYILFLVDDNIFVRDFRLSDITNGLAKEKKVIGFALQLGVNIHYCYPLNIQLQLPTHVPVVGDVIKYRWTEAGNGLNYPLEVSSSVYRWKEIAPLIAGLRFSNPNILESQLAANAVFYRRTHPDLLCYRQSVTFCNPVNKVQNTNNNKAGGNQEYSANTLAQLFEKGTRINIHAYNGLIPNACHQEVELVFSTGEE